MKFLIGMLLSLNAFAVSECIEFPVYEENVEIAYKGKITEISERLSFYNCPESILVADRFISNIKQVIDYKNEKRCLYKVVSIHILCRK